MKAENLRQFTLSASIDKLIHTEWSIPPVEKALPWFFALCGGFMCASVISMSVASLLMPNHNAKPKKVGTKSQIELETVHINLPPPPLLADFKTITKRNLFNSEGALAEGNEGKVQCELKKSELPLKFTGVIFGGTSSTSLVVIESQGTKQVDTFLQYDMLPGEVLLTEITRNRVYLERNGCKEYLELEELPLPKRRVASNRMTRKDSLANVATSGDAFKEDGFVRQGGKIQVERRWVDKALGIDFAKTLQDAKANPNLVGGNEIKGFVLTKIRPNSVYEKMGLKDGDIVRSINGIELSGMAQAVQTLNQMRNEANVALAVERAGQTLNLNIDIRK